MIQARAVEGREADDMLRAKELSLSMTSSSGAAEALSFKLWDTDWCSPPTLSQFIKSFKFLLPSRMEVDVGVAVSSSRHAVSECRLLQGKCTAFCELAGPFPIGWISSTEARLCVYILALSWWNSQ